MTTIVRRGERGRSPGGETRDEKKSGYDKKNETLMQQAESSLVKKERGERPEIGNWHISQLLAGRKKERRRFDT